MKLDLKLRSISLMCWRKFTSTFSIDFLYVMIQKIVMISFTVKWRHYVFLKS